MLFNLSLKNIKKSLKDYSIYFFTLVIGVCIFYMFNSLDAQNSMLVMTESKKDIIKSLVEVLGYVSVFVSFILGFLIIYSNNFLIKRRKKEFGLYLTLGMSKRKVSTILVIETLVVGIVSLIVGLILGIGLSQILSLLVAKMFEAKMDQFAFVFSNQAFAKTLLYFGIIFILVMIFNVISLSRFKLIDLLTAGRKNEKIKFRNKYVIIISFILSIALIYYAYSLLFDHVLIMMGTETVIMLIAGAIGTFLLFFSLSGFLLTLIKKSKIYTKGLNMFILNQVNSKINSTVISTTFICLMLLLTIGILSSSLSLASIFNNDMSKNNLTDYTVVFNDDYNYRVDENGNEYLDKEALQSAENFVKGKDILKYSKDFVLVHRYFDKSLTARSLITEKEIDRLEKKYGSSLDNDYNIPIIKESDYKKLMQVEGIKPVDIDDDEYLILANIDLVVETYSDLYNNDGKIKVNGKVLNPGTDEIIEVAISNSAASGNDGVIVVSDDVVDNLECLSMMLIGNYIDNSNSEQVDNDFDNLISTKSGCGYNLMTKTSIEASSVGVKSIVIFVGLYLGIVFAITSATVLAIGQLSDSSDNKSRYRVLKQIGADEKMINKSLFVQILIVFLFPLLVALVHCYFGLKEVNTIIVSLGEIDLTSNILLTTLFMLIVYGGYFLATYLCSKSIIKND